MLRAVIPPDTPLPLKFVVYDDEYLNKVVQLIHRLIKRDIARVLVGEAGNFNIELEAALQQLKEHYYSEGMRDNDKMHLIIDKEDWQCP